MVRIFLGILGVVAALLPDRTVNLFERLAIDNPEDCTPKPWTNPAIRTEGIVIAAASLSGGRAYAWLMNLTGVFGGVVLLFPDLYRKLATTLLYENPDQVKWNDSFASGVRVVGALYVGLAVWAFKNRREDK